ncbi:MAG: hypothetical protein A2104_10435 [Candidatus Melainabacteria bacterium GWF2_32_7]|nr:MAG: hypothetical protein A2104_10435 [Candidatus Melainabacteria bacterium GWF2_32_7]
MNFIERLKFIRQYTNSSQEEFAKTLGISQKTISYWEQGRNEPQIETLRVLSDKFGINLHWLITGKGEFLVEKEEILSLEGLKEKYNLTNEELKLLNELLTSPEKRKALLNLLK